MVIKKGVLTVLNLNGKKFENRNGNKNGKAALQVRGSLTINGDGDVICEGGADNNAVLAEDGGHLIINGGTYYVDKDANGKSNATIYARKACTIEINGGIFSAEPDAEGKTPYVLNQEKNITENCFSVRGGIFVGFNPADVNECQGKVTSFVAEGYRSVETTYNGKQAWKVEEIPAVTTQKDFETAVAEKNVTVKLTEGKYTIPETVADGITIEGGENTIINIPAAVTWTDKKVIFKGITIKSPNTDYIGIKHASSLNFENCTFVGMRCGYATKEIYKNCKFIQEDEQYSMWTYGANIDYIDCTFTGKGKFINVYNEGLEHLEINIKNCKFESTVKNKPAINIKRTGNGKNLDFTVNIEKCSVSGAFPEVNGGLWQVDNAATAENNKVIVNVDGTKVYLN